MAFASNDAKGGRKAAIWLGVILVLALALRIVFNVGPAFDEEHDRYLYSGNDPWYHDHTVEHIVQTGESLVADPAINYPNGARNPNPPVYDWTTAMDAKFLDMMGATDPVGLSLNLAVAFWGALTIIPVYMIGKSMWGRSAGLWGAFFLAVSAPHIQRSVFGFADHDATAMFFITLAFAFMIKALKAIHRKEYVGDWRHDAMTGIRAAWSGNQVAIRWSALAGISLAAVALTWKGYPYALGVMAAAFGFQLLVDHARNRDSTVVSFVYLIPVVVSLLVALPYYTEMNLARGTTTPHIYVLIGMLVAAVLLVPTRDMPSILVFPSLIVAAALGLLALWLIVPQTAELIFTGLGYFRQTKLYSTIAEAQRTELGFIAANFGFFTFLLAFWGWGRSVRHAWKGEAASMLMAAWALVAFFMAFAASRFVMNAAPVFAVLAGAATTWILAKAGLDAVARRRRQLHGQGSGFGNSFRSLTGRSITVVLLVGLLLFLPNAWLGVDAATSADFEREHGLDTPRLGAFGIGFDVGSSGWLDLFDHLAEQDMDRPIGERPGFIAWWDYGHWAVAIGAHPAVATPFQHHYEVAGRFLASESEEEATVWLTILLMDAHRPGGTFSSSVAPVLEAHGIDEAAYGGDYDDKYAVVDAAVDGDAVHDLYHDLMDATDQSIEYLGVDSRMFPINIQQTGIFYAPVFLANKNPDAFLETVYIGQGVQLTLQQYDVDEDGDSYRLDQPRWVDANGDPWVVVGNEAFRGESLSLTQQLGAATGTGVQVQPQFRTTERFDATMYAKAFGSIDPSVLPGDGLTHWKVIFEHKPTSGGQEFRQTALLEYFRGHEVSGVVRDGNGDPMQGVQVTFVDEIGAAHGVATTDDNGTFSVLAPFGELELTVRVLGQDIHSQPWTQPRSADGGSTGGVQVDIPLAGLEGVAYRDLDGDGEFNATQDEILVGAEVSLGDLATTTTGSDGRYAFEGVPAGRYSVTVSQDGYESGGAFAVLVGGETVSTDVIMRALPSQVTVTFLEDGEPVDAVPIEFDGATTTTRNTDVNGTATVTLQPGTYEIVIDHSFTLDGVEVVYDETRTLIVPFGGDPVALTIEAS